MIDCRQMTDMVDLTLGELGTLRVGTIDDPLPDGNVREFFRPDRAILIDNMGVSPIRNALKGLASEDEILAIANAPMLHCMAEYFLTMPELVNFKPRQIVDIIAQRRREAVIEILLCVSRELPSEFHSEDHENALVFLHGGLFLETVTRDPFHSTLIVVYVDLTYKPASWKRTAIDVA
jgi:hypothetical protein